MKVCPRASVIDCHHQIMMGDIIISQILSNQGFLQQKNEHTREKKRGEIKLHFIFTDRIRMAGRSFGCASSSVGSLPSITLWCLASFMRACIAKAQ